LYGISITWLVAMFIFIIFAKSKQRVAIKKSGVDIRLNFSEQNTTDRFPLMRSIKKYFKKPTQKEEELEEENYLNDFENKPTEKKRDSFYFTYDYENGNGELYMRCGTAIFSICAMIDQCLSLIQLIDLYNNKHDASKDCKTNFTVSIIEKIFSFMFTFLQAFFIFKYANIIINYRKNALHIGIMHIICTNLCVSFRTIVHETVSEILHYRHTYNHGKIY